MLRFRQWDDILKTTEPDQRLPAYRALWRFARVAAYARKKQPAEAAKEKAAFEVARSKVPVDAPWLVNKAADVLSLASVILYARLASNDTAAIPHWKRAVALQDGLQYDEPPAWFYPVRESLGGALLRAGQHAEAEAVFRKGCGAGPATDVCYSD